MVLLYMVCHGSHQYTPVMLAYIIYQHHGSYENPMGHYNILQLNQLALWGTWNVLKCVEMCVCVCWPLAKAGENWQLVDEQNLSCAFAAFFKASYSWLNTTPQCYSVPALSCLCAIHGPKTIQIKMIPRLFGNIGIQWKPMETTGFLLEAVYLSAPSPPSSRLSFLFWLLSLEELTGGLYDNWKVWLPAIKTY